MAFWEALAAPFVGLPAAVLGGKAVRGAINAPKEEYDRARLSELEAKANAATPVWEQIRANKGLLESPFQLDPTKSASYTALSNRALSTGPSSWADYMTQKQQQEQQAAMDQALQQQAGAEAGAISQLGMRGGVSGGAAERLAKAGLKDRLLAQQGVAQQGIGQRLGILAQDEAAKTDLQKTLASGDVSAQQFNIAQALAEKQREAEFQAERERIAQQAASGERMAQAQERSKGK